MKRLIMLMWAGIFLFPPLGLEPAWAASLKTNDAAELVTRAFHYLRGLSSESLIEMTIHRPAWERSVTIRAWTRGERQSLFTTLAPPKDKGNGTLKIDTTMWMYNPKVNRVIKLPPSMMSQAWMGSDFSNNDLAKSDTLIRDYRHELLDTTVVNGIKVFHIRSVPLPDAPVVWGKIELKIRQDLIMLEETFFDEDMEPVKQMTTQDIRTMGGRLFPASWFMRKTGTTDEYTRIDYREISFDASFPDSLFSLSGLKQAGR